MGLSEHKSAILKLLILTVIFIVVIAYLIISHYRDYIIKNWTQYRTNPFIIPFAGFLRKDGEKRSFIDFTKNNFSTWIWTLSKTFFSYLIKPVQYILKMITSVINGFTNTLNIFRYQAKIIRKMFADIVITTAEKISNSYAAMQFYQAKLIDLTKRQQAMFQIMLYFADAMKMTLSSLINGPVLGLVNFFPTFGVVLLILIAVCLVCFAEIPFVSWVACPICLVCFEPKTNISMKDMTSKPIYLVELGDYVELGGKVTSTLVFHIANRKCDVYNYKGVIVSGSHLTFEDDRPIRISESKWAKKLTTDHMPKYLCCLNTEHHRLLIKGQVYSDFHECSDIHKNQQTMSLVIQALNYETIDINKFHPNDPTYQWGLGKGTKIYNNNGYLKNIEDIQIGDNLAGGGEVYGLVKHLADGIDVYSDGELTLSGTQTIKKCGIWERFYMSPNTMIVDYRDKYIYHIVTRRHILISEGYKFLTDYLELSEGHPVFDTIHSLNMKSVKI